MQNVTNSWNTIFSASHKTEYRFDIAGVSYCGNDIKGTPVIVKPLLDKPAIGRVCTGSLKLSVYPKSDIPKAATVNAYCRIVSADGNTASEWIPQGKYYITSRSGQTVVTLSCLDCMIKTGVTYRDKSAFTEWPVSMSSVVNEICQITGITLDMRTVIKSDTAYVVDYPNDDMLISEILGMIAVAHGGNWIMTEAGELRMVPLSSPTTVIDQNIEKSHKGYTPKGKVQNITGIILTDFAGNEFTAGNDSGITIGAKCDYATQEIADDVYTALYGTVYTSYSIDSAYLNPAIELGDTIFVVDKNGFTHSVVAQSIVLNCTVAATCTVAAGSEDETEDEYPYISARDLALNRTVKTNQSYFGNRINRSEGFVSEYIVDGELLAKMTANASQFTMQAIDEYGELQDSIYFDPVQHKYVITGDVLVNGAVTIEDLATAGRTIISGDNITTGVLQSHDGRVRLDLDHGTLTVGGTNIEDAISSINDTINIVPSSQLFTKSTNAENYIPTSITLIAQTANALNSYTWYKNNEIISGATTYTITILPTDISGTQATFKVVGVDANEKEYIDIITVAKLADGTDGADGESGYTITLDDEYIEIPTALNGKPISAFNRSCTVNVYRGTKQLTAVSDTVSTDTYTVTVTNTVSGITVSQIPSNVITISATPDTAIPDATTINLTIGVYDCDTDNPVYFYAAIKIRSNITNAAVSSLQIMESSIATKVSKDNLISEINQSAEGITISAGKVDLSGYASTAQLNTSVANYIDSANGRAVISSVVSGQYIPVTATGVSNTTLNVELLKTTSIASINSSISSLDSSISLSSAYGSNSIGSNVRALLTLFANKDSSNIRLAANALTLTATPGATTNIETSVGNYAITVGAPYGFSQDADGYYVSENTGVNSSYAYGYVFFDFPTETTITIRCVSYGENNYDYGIVSNVDVYLKKDYSADSSGVFHSFKGESSANAVDLTMTIPAGDHFITFKYIKDSSQSSYGDYFKIKFLLITASTSSETILSLSSGGTILSSANINITGAVTFADLMGEGTTQINGANILTDNLYVKKVYFNDSSHTHTIIDSEKLSASNYAINVGVKEAQNNYIQYCNIYGDYIYFLIPGDTFDYTATPYARGRLVMDLRTGLLLPSTGTSFNLGTPSNSFGYVYASNLNAANYNFNDNNYGAVLYSENGYLVYSSSRGTTYLT